MAFHPLLVRQLRGLTMPSEDAFPGWSALLERVSEAYAQADVDQQLHQRSIELSSQELLHQNAEMRIVLQAFPDLYLRLAPDGRILSCRAGHPDDLLFPAEQLIGRRIQTLPGQVARQRFRHALGGVTRGGPAQVVEYALTVGGLERMYEARLLPLRGDQVMAIVRNITERKQAEAELVRTREAAVGVARIKSEFMANMSHEIRTPLTCVIGMTELVLDMDLSTEARGFLTSVKVSADALHGIVNDLLDFSRMESGKVELEEISFSLRDCVGTTVSSLAFRAEQKGLELVCNISARAAERLVGDPSRLRQMLLHLVGNAIKFTERGEVVVKLDVIAETPTDTTLRFSVRDTGIGIPVDKQAAIFEAFAQADGSTTRRYGGTGLGLAIVTQVIELMRGDLHVESELGVGSTFTFEVTFARERAAPSPTPPASLDVLEGMHVLVVDDNATNRSLFAGALEGWRAHPTTVPGGKEALDELDRAKQAGTPYGLVLLDMHMPGRDGFDGASTIAAHLDAGVPILVLTSTGRPGDAARCRELGLAGYLTKPVLNSELLEAIRAIVRRPSPGQARTLVTRHSLREDGRRLRILLAEDNHLNRTIITRILEKRGYSVVAVEDGRRALEMLEREVFDVVLMDIQMPELDGLETMGIIRTREVETGGHMPIVALTAHATSGDEERCRAAGADAYLIKPIDSQQLLVTIEMLGAGRDGKADVSAPGAAREAFDEAGALRRLNGDRVLLEEIIILHLENRTGFLIEFDRALEIADSGKLRRLAHEMKGELATLGAVPAAEAASQLEIAATAEDVDASNRAAQVLRDELYRLEGALERPRQVA